MKSEKQNIIQGGSNMTKCLICGNDIHDDTNDNKFCIDCELTREEVTNNKGDDDNE